MSITPSEIAAWLPIARSIGEFFVSIFQRENRAPTDAELTAFRAGLEQDRIRVVRAEDAHEAAHGG